MRLFPAEHERWGVFSRLATYLGGIVILFWLFSALAANLVSPGEKRPAGPTPETVGAAQRTIADAAQHTIADDEFSEANRAPTWIVPTTKYNPTPAANAKAAKSKTIAVRKFEPQPKSRMARQPVISEEASSAYGYAGSVRRPNRYEQFDNMPAGSLTARRSLY